MEKGWAEKSQRERKWAFYASKRLSYLNKGKTKTSGRFSILRENPLLRRTKVKIDTMGTRRITLLRKFFLWIFLRRLLGNTIARYTQQLFEQCFSTCGAALTIVIIWYSLHFARDSRSRNQYIPSNSMVLGELQFLLFSNFILLLLSCFLFCHNPVQICIFVR